MVKAIECHSGLFRVLHVLRSEISFLKCEALYRVLKNFLFEMFWFFYILLLYWKLDVIVIIIYPFFIPLAYPGGWVCFVFVNLFISAETTVQSSITLQPIYDATTYQGALNACVTCLFFKKLRLRTCISLTFSCCFSGLSCNPSFCFAGPQGKFLN